MMIRVMHIAVVAVLMGGCAKHTSKWDELYSSATNHHAHQQYDVAESNLLAALAIAEERDMHPMYSARTMSTLAHVRHAQGCRREACSWQTNAIGIYRTIGKTNSIEFANELYGLAVIQRSSLDHDEAIRSAEEMVHIYRSIYGPDHPKLAAVLYQLGSGFYSRTFKLDKASTAFREAIKIWEGKEQRDPYYYPLALCDLAMILDLQGRTPEAVPLYKRGIEKLETHLGPEEPSVKKAQELLAKMERKLAQNRNSQPSENLLK